MKGTFRMGKRHRVVSFRIPIVTLWYLLQHPNSKEDGNYSYIKQYWRKYVANAVKKWKYAHSNGVSEFIAEQMILSFLEPTDQVRYKRLLKIFKENNGGIKKILPDNVKLPPKEYGWF